MHGETTVMATVQPFAVIIQETAHFGHGAVRVAVPHHCRNAEIQARHMLDTECCGGRCWALKETILCSRRNCGNGVTPMFGRCSCRGGYTEPTARNIWMKYRSPLVKYCLVYLNYSI